MVGGAWVVVITPVAIHRRSGNGEQASTVRELVDAIAICQEAVVANAMETIRQCVEEEPVHRITRASLGCPGGVGLGSPN